MKRGLVLLVLVGILLIGFCAMIVGAHLPRMVGVGERDVIVENPGVSQAFYGELRGHEQVYVIDSEEEFELYVSMTVPDIEGRRMDFVYEIMKDGKVIGIINGSKEKWYAFHEEFANDDYLQGGEFDENVSAGLYEVRVSNLDNDGKYVFVVGKKESFTLKEIVKTLVNLPRVKKYFGKSMLGAYFNLIGLMIFGPIIAFIALILGIWWFVKRRCVCKIREEVEGKVRRAMRKREKKEISRKNGGNFRGKGGKNKGF